MWQRLVKSGNTFDPRVAEVTALSVDSSYSLAGICGMVAPEGGALGGAVAEAAEVAKPAELANNGGVWIVATGVLNETDKTGEEGQFLSLCACYRECRRVIVTMSLLLCWCVTVSLVQRSSVLCLPPLWPPAVLPTRRSRPHLALRE